MTVQQSEFRFGDVSLTLKSDITYHDHLYRIQKALWPQMCAEVAKTHPGPLSEAEDVFTLSENFRAAAGKDDLFDRIGAATVDAIVGLGYDRERMGATVRDWILKCAEDGYRALQHPDIYGAARYDTPPLSLPSPRKLKR